MNKELKDIIDKDLSRVYTLPMSFKQKFFMPEELKYLILFRKASFYHQKNAFFRKHFYNLKLIKMTKRTHINIPSETCIGEGFYIGHLGKIIINPKAVIGRNVNIATGVTIGQTNRGSKKGVPTIGDNVWIGTNSVIVGNITIGDDVLIAPLTLVNVDVPSHSVVSGNPCTITPRENATEDYINRCV